MTIDYKSFEKLITSVREYYSRLDKVEHALGGIVLDDFYNLPLTLCKEIENATGIVWTDDIWECINLPNVDCPVKDIWGKIERLKGESNG